MNKLFKNNYTISKSELIIPKYLKGTYFEILKNTNVGSDICKLTLDEIFFCHLMYI